VIHRCGNLVAKVPTHAQDQVKRDYWAIFDDITARARRGCGGRGPPAGGRVRPPLARPLPAAVACLTDTLLIELTCFLRFPREHWARIRHTNLIERTFGETRRRVKVIGRLPGEQSCLSLVWAVLDRAWRGWRGVVMTPAAVRLLPELRRQLHHPSRLEEGWSTRLSRPPRNMHHRKRDATPGCEDAQPKPLRRS
jgi:putative transposase